MDLFKDELDTGDIHIHDRWQFEIKSKFVPTHARVKSEKVQEIYFFIPNALQINPQTYFKDNFYRDLTNMIRYKTPEFTLRQLLNFEDELSPFCRLWRLKGLYPNKENKRTVQDELKLFGNIFRSALRCDVREIIVLMDNPQNDDAIKEALQRLREQLQELHHHFDILKEGFDNLWKDSVTQDYFKYINEFICQTSHYYLVNILEHLRSFNRSSLSSADALLTTIILEERKQLLTFLDRNLDSHSEEVKSGQALYKMSLLNKFVVDALLLNSNRVSFHSKYNDIIGAVAAGIAMLFFMIFFILQYSVVVEYSEPYVVITVFLYILKDRIKEGLKALSTRFTAKWFSDYNTEIRSPDNETLLGSLKEGFSFLEEREVPKDILKIRNREFHAVLESFKRPEQVFYYLKKVVMKVTKQPKGKMVRREALNIIFRFNVRNLLYKADEPQKQYLKLEPQTKQIIRSLVPKVYHINVIMKSSYISDDNKRIQEIKKFRLIVNQDGIQSVEAVSQNNT